MSVKPKNKKEEISEDERKQIIKQTISQQLLIQDLL